jgi:hypothetical protein
MVAGAAIAATVETLMKILRDKEWVVMNGSLLESLR